jgi:glycosyltransferase involved in cell wall biosynthesis
LFPKGDYADRFVFIPNLLQEDNPYIRKPVRYIENVNNLSFGFVGLNRYVSPLNFAEVVGEKFSQHKFYFYGNGFEDLMKKIQNLTDKYENIYAKGRFNSTTELEEIYSKIDVLICCYDVTNTNVKLAEPNKLYEAIFFNKPIIVSSGTFLQKRVETLGVGYAVNAMDANSLEVFIRSLIVEDINLKLTNISKIPTSELIDDGSAVVKLILRYAE